MKTPHDVLGIPKDATKDQVKKAYRKKAKETHTDREGDGEEFKRVNAAYKTLTDDRLRDRWEKTGDWENVEPDNSNTAAVNVLVQVLDQVMGDLYAANVEPQTRNVVALMRGVIQEGQHKLEDHRKGAERQVKFWTKAAGRFKKKNGPAFLEGVVTTRLIAAKAGLAQVEENIQTGLAALEMLADVEYDHEKPEPITATGTIKTFTLADMTKWW